MPNIEIKHSEESATITVSHHPDANEIKAIGAVKATKLTINFQFDSHITTINTVFTALSENASSDLTINPRIRAENGEQNILPLDKLADKGIEKLTIKWRGNYPLDGVSGIPKGITYFKMDGSVGHNNGMFRKHHLRSLFNALEHTDVTHCYLESIKFEGNGDKSPQEFKYYSDYLHQKYEPDVLRKLINEFNAVTKTNITHFGMRNCGIKRPIFISNLMVALQGAHALTSLDLSSNLLQREAIYELRNIPPSTHSLNLSQSIFEPAWFCPLTEKEQMLSRKIRQLLFLPNTLTHLVLGVHDSEWFNGYSRSKLFKEELVKVVKAKPHLLSIDFTGGTELSAELQEALAKNYAPIRRILSKILTPHVEVTALHSIIADYVAPQVRITALMRVTPPVKPRSYSYVREHETQQVQQLIRRNSL